MEWFSFTFTTTSSRFTKKRLELEHRKYQRIKRVPLFERNAAQQTGVEWISRFILSSNNAVRQAIAALLFVNLHARPLIAGTRFSWPVRDDAVREAVTPSMLVFDWRRWRRVGTCAGFGCRTRGELGDVDLREGVHGWTREAGFEEVFGTLVWMVGSEEEKAPSARSSV